MGPKWARSGPAVMREEHRRKAALHVLGRQQFVERLLPVDAIGEQSELAFFFEQQVYRYAALHELHVAISRDHTYSKTAALARAAASGSR